MPATEASAPTLGGRVRGAMTRAPTSAAARAAHLRETLGWRVYAGFAGLAAIDIALVIGGFPISALLITLLTFLVLSGTQALVSILICTALVTRFRIEINGAHFMLEHLVVLAFLIAALLERRLADLIAVLRNPIVLALGAFIAWEGIASITRAPEASESLRIVAWLGLDWLLLICVISTVGAGRRIERLAVGTSIVLAATAVALWIGYSLDLTSLGTQGGYEHGRSIHGLGFEANILASCLAVWGFVALSSEDPRISRWFRFLVPLFVLAIAVTLTRSAIIAFFAGLVVWAILGDRTARRRTALVVIVSICVGLIATVALPDLVRPVQDRVENLTNTGTGSGNWRLDSSKTALEDLDGLSLVTGLGTNSFGQRHADEEIPSRGAYLPVLPLQILYDSGLIGVALLGFAFVKLRPFTATRRARALSITAVYLVAATATSPFWFGWTWVLIALAIMTVPPKGDGPVRSPLTSS